MTETVIEVKGLKELLARMQKYPVESAKAQALTMSAALITLWENVPPYPPAPPSSAYDRTGTLGKTLGVGESGGVSGNPDIYTVKPLGGGFEGRFGTKLSYAEYVIGDDTQAAVHQGRWWTMQVVANKASEKIVRLFNTLAEKLARFLDGKASL